MLGGYAQRTIITVASRLPGPRTARKRLRQGGWGYGSPFTGDTSNSPQGGR
jgi:hypothetical protein